MRADPIHRNRQTKPRTRPKFHAQHQGRLLEDAEGLVLGHLVSPVPRQRSAEGRGEFANVRLSAATATVVSLLGTLMSVVKREYRSSRVTK